MLFKGFTGPKLAHKLSPTQTSSVGLIFSRRAQILIGFWPSKTLKEHPETSMEAWWGPYRALFGNISSHFGGYVEPCRGYVGSKNDQDLSPSRMAQIFGVFLPENRFQRPPWNFIRLEVIEAPRIILKTDGPLTNLPPHRR